MYVCRNRGHRFAVDVEFLHLVEHEQVDVVFEEDVGSTGAHQFELSRKEEQGVALVIFENLGYGVGVIWQYGYAVDAAVGSFRCKAQQCYGVETAFELALESRGKEE